ncbi:MAG TPA: GNAT family N-acetyltransferase [Rhizomicrobium sp.]|nr:GNAT family N-acetyltransferase [Rhizomicrobium sp.]
MTRPIFTDLAPEAGLPDALLALNNHFAMELSPLDPAKARHLVRHAFMARTIGDEALLIAFDQDAPYDNANFGWFHERYDHFVYIDRVAIAPLRQGWGWAGLLYESLFARAREKGHVRVACEINLDPPNPRSETFHAGLGFEPVGQAILADARKTVRYFCKAIIA